MSDIGPLFGALSKREKLMAAYPGITERFLSWAAVQPDGFYWQYVNWVMRCAAAFRKEHGIRRDDLFSDHQQKDFTAWLWEHGAEFLEALL
jgi:hypothetical protein